MTKPWEPRWSVGRAGVGAPWQSGSGVLSVCISLCPSPKPAQRDDALSRNTSLEEQLRQAHAEISRGQAQLAASEAMCTSLQRELESVPRLEPPSPSAASAGAQLGRSKQLVMAYREARATSAVPSDMNDD